MTLVEVLLAAVVCGAGLSVVLSAVASSVRADRHADALVRATRLLDVLLGRIEGGFVTLTPQNGDFSQDGEPDVSWTMAVDPTQTENLTQITLTATWIESETDDPKTLVIYRLMYQDPDAANAAGAGSQTQVGSGSKTTIGSGSKMSSAQGAGQ